jgi:hypothetical protein
MQSLKKQQPHFEKNKFLFKTILLITFQNNNTTTKYYRKVNVKIFYA